MINRIVLGACLFLLWHNNVCPEEVSLETLFQKAEFFDQKEVCFSGEVIGEPLCGTGGLWINVADNGQNIGVLINKKKDIKDIEFFGSYAEKGDIIKVIGVFTRDCGGSSENGVFAERIEVLRKGGERIDDPGEEKQDMALKLSIICLTLGVIYFIKYRIWKRR